MGSTSELRRRIKTAGNISKITRAMESVAASKMKKAQDVAAAGRSYERLMREMAEHLLRFASGADHPLLASRGQGLTGSMITVLITPDRGLCGSLTSNVLRLAEQMIQRNGAVITMGQKATVHAAKTSWVLIGSVEKLGDKPLFADTLPASSLALEEFTAGNADGIQMIYPKFITTLTQQPTLEHILPLGKLALTAGETILRPTYIFEPTGRAILDELLPAYVRLTLYQAVLSMKASEYSARMVAMKQASENAQDVRKHLILQFNQDRQRQITAEIADIVTAGLAIG